MPYCVLHSPDMLYTTLSCGDPPILNIAGDNSFVNDIKFSFDKFNVNIPAFGYHLPPLSSFFQKSNVKP